MKCEFRHGITGKCSILNRFCICLEKEFRNKEDKCIVKEDKLIKIEKQKYIDRYQQCESCGLFFSVDRITINNLCKYCSLHKIKTI